MSFMVSFWTLDFCFDYSITVYRDKHVWLIRVKKSDLVTLCVLSYCHSCIQWATTKRTHETWVVDPEELSPLRTTANLVYWWSGLNYKAHISRNPETLWPHTTVEPWSATCVMPLRTNYFVAEHAGSCTWDEVSMPLKLYVWTLIYSSMPLFHALM